MTVTEALQEQNESRLARALSKAFRESRRLVQDALDDGILEGGDITELPLEVWDEIAADLQKAIRPALEEAYIEAAAEFAGELAYGVDEAQLATEAQAWAATYSFDLVTGLNQTSRAQLTGALSQFFEGSMTNQQLTKKIASVFGPARANTIAVTEVTRAAAEGQAWVAAQLGAAGAQMIAIWETRLDELVCPICGPRHDQVQGTNWIMLPPAHPNCRCGVRYQPIEGVG